MNARSHLDGLPRSDAPGTAPDPAPDAALALLGGDCGFWELDVPRDEVRWWNDWCENFDVEACIGPGHSPRWDRNVHPDDQAALQARRAAMISGENPR